MTFGFRNLAILFHFQLPSKENKKAFSLSKNISNTREK